MAFLSISRSLWLASAEWCVDVAEFNRLMEEQKAKRKGRSKKRSSLSQAKNERRVDSDRQVKFYGLLTEFSECSRLADCCE